MNRFCGAYGHMRIICMALGVCLDAGDCLFLVLASHCCEICTKRVVSIDGQKGYLTNRSRVTEEIESRIVAGQYGQKRLHGPEPFWSASLFEYFVGERRVEFNLVIVWCGWFFSCAFNANLPLSDVGPASLTAWPQESVFLSLIFVCLPSTSSVWMSSQIG